MNGSNRELKLMRAYVALTTLLTTVLLVSGFAPKPESTRFEEISVERINVVEKDGKLRMVITNKERSPGAMERGIPYQRGGRRSGLVFYNDEGTENGGLSFGSYRKGEQFEAGAQLAFDQYDQDQIVALQYYESNGRRRAGLGIGEYPTSITNKERAERYEQARKMPDGPAKQQALEKLRVLDGKTRAFFGKADDGSVVLRLHDAAGKARLRLRVEAQGGARIEFLDDSGRVVRAIPDEPK